MEVTNANPQTIVYKLRPEAVWSDGVPVSADDFVYAFEMQRPGLTDIDGSPISVVAPNEDVIASVTGSDGGKTVTVVLKQPFGDWQALFLTPLSPPTRPRPWAGTRASTKVRPCSRRDRSVSPVKPRAA